MWECCQADALSEVLKRWIRDEVDQLTEAACLIGCDVSGVGRRHFLNLIISEDLELLYSCHSFNLKLQI